MHDVETPTGEAFIVSMPTKFRNTVWIKRGKFQLKQVLLRSIPQDTRLLTRVYLLWFNYSLGDYVIVEPIKEGNKVKAEIQQILTKDHVRYIRSQGLWYELTNLLPPFKTSGLGFVY